MPLHLLGKKSWNVYNTANIEKVRKDEADAAAREEAHEQRLQEADAVRRFQILRGEQVDPLPAPDEQGADPAHDAKRDGPGRERKRRRIAGEDDTDREMRYAREDREMQPAKAVMHMTSKKSSDAPLTDRQGHINLFPSEAPNHKNAKNAEAEAEKAKKKKELEDQYTMRFSNAAGFKQDIGQTPWYQTPGTGKASQSPEPMPSKDVWGNDDPRRKEREKMRIATDDPLAMMRSGAAGVREAEKQRTKWREEKFSELKDLEQDERRRERKRRKHRENDDLEDFSLDSPQRFEGRRHHRDRNGDVETRHPHRHRSHSRDRDPSRHHRHRHRSRDGHRKEVAASELSLGSVSRSNRRYSREAVVS